MTAFDSKPRLGEDHLALLARIDAALDRVERLTPMADERFLETHEVYEGSSDQQSRIIEWFGASLPPPRATPPPLSVLGVGSGSGVIDLEVARHLAGRVDEIEYLGLDPNRVECDEFERRFGEAALPGVSAAVEATTFDSFESEQPFDLIHFVQCLYYMPAPDRAVERAREMLAPEGSLVVFHAPRGELNELAGRFYDKLYGRPTPFAADCAAALEREGLDYHRERLGAHVDVTSLVEGDAEAGLALRDFILQIDSSELPDDLQELVERYLRAVVREREGRAVIPHPVDVFTIPG